MAERLTGKKLKKICIDGGKEFINEKWKVWAKGLGITIDHTLAYSSATNGVVERKHAVTFTKVCVILDDSGLPPSLWAIAATYVVYMENLLPSSWNSFHIPAEIFYKI